VIGKELVLGFQAAA